MIYLQLFLSFLQVGLFSIGGGYAAIPLIQSAVVDTRGWMSLNEFTHLITIAEMTPGPIFINGATFVGNRMAGIPGAIVATFGSILPSLIIVSLLAYLYIRYKKLDLLHGTLSTIRPVVISLIMSAGLSILLLLLFNNQPKVLTNTNWLGLVIFAIAFFILRRFKWNPILVMFLCGLSYLGIDLLLSTVL